MESKIFLLDSSFLIALFDESDSLSRRAVDLAKTLSAADKLVITNYIYSEIATVLSQRKGKSFDLQAFIKKVGINLAFCNEDIFNEAVKKYPSLTNKNISFVDLVTAIYAQSSNINGVVTFDKHFNQLGRAYGFSVLSSIS